MFEVSGTVYILENIEAHRIKVGVTINNPEGRLLDINRIWQGDKGRCQICGNRRLLDANGMMPIHVLSMRHCKGSHEKPIEIDTSLAKQELEILKSDLVDISGKAKGAAVKKVKAFENLIEFYSNQPKRVGVWQISALFAAKKAYLVEASAHEILSEYLDSDASIGEVFSCSVDIAISAVQAALHHYE